MDWKYLFTSFDGRIGRQQFWISAIILAVMSIILSFVVLSVFGVGIMAGMMSGDMGMDEMLRINSASGWGSLVVLLIMAWPSLAIMLKRRHDRGSAGRGVKAYFALTIVLLLLQGLGIGYSVQEFAGQQMIMPNPIVAAVGFALGLYGLFLLVVMGFLKGDEGSNSFGPDPLET